MTQAVNLYRDEIDVYIGRPGKGQDGYFGNPEDLEKHGGDRVKCLDAYRVYFEWRLASDPEFAKRIESLRGKRLGCFCMPNFMSWYGDCSAS